MVALDASLTATVDLDVKVTVEGLGPVMAAADFGEIRFDASAILDLVAQVAPPELSGVLDAVAGVGLRLAARAEVGLPGAELPGQLEGILRLLDGVGPVIPDVEIPTEIGLSGLLARAGTVDAAVRAGPLPGLFGLLPGLRLDAALDGTGGALTGLVELARILASLTATAAVSRRLVFGADLLAGRLALPGALAAGRRLGALSADTGLVAELRAADPLDVDAAAALGVRVAEFAGAVVEVSDRWSLGMGTGEATLLGLDLAGGAAGLELARLALAGADSAAVGRLATLVRGLADPLLRTELPVAQGEDALIQQAIGGVDLVRESLAGWDPATTVAPVTAVLDTAVQPLTEIRAAVETVAGGAASAIRAVRDLVEGLDLSSVRTAVQVALQPLSDAMDAIRDAVAVAEQAIRDVCDAITRALDGVAGTVGEVAGRVQQALGRARTLLADLKLGELAESLSAELTTVAGKLAAAQLSPYFDTAIEVIDTGAEVIDAVPFGLLPTDVQQEIVDVAKPIKRLDLDPVEATLRQVLQDIRTELDTTALDAIDEAFQAVVEVLAELDPEPALQELEDGPMADLRARVAEIDPQALLQPVTETLAEFRGLLADLDLPGFLIEPLAELFAPIQQALAGLQPGELLRPLREAVDGARQRVLDLLHLDAVTDAATTVRDQVAGGLQRLDPAGLVAALVAEVAARLGELPAGPPGGPFGSLLVSLAEASGMEATELALGDALTWVRSPSGSDAGATVRGRLQLVAERLAGVHADVTLLDPVPLGAAAGAQHRALTAALAVHPEGSPLRLAVGPVLAGSVPAELLGPLAENRQRYRRALELDVTLAASLAASGRAELSTAAGDLARELAPLQAFGDWARRLLAALGIEGSDAPLPDLLRTLYAAAGPAQVLPALTGLLELARERALTALDTLLAPVLAAVGEVRGTIEALDVGPVIAEVEQLHALIVTEVAALSPAGLLGPVVADAQAVIDRLAGFDPLKPVEDVVRTALDTARRVLETARPTVVFADAIGLHHDLLSMAQGLNVKALLRPALDALDGLAVQLDDGFVRTTDALQRLQAALPDHVEESSLSASVSVSVSAGVGFR